MEIKAGRLGGRKSLFFKGATRLCGFLWLLEHESPKALYGFRLQLVVALLSSASHMPLHIEPEFIDKILMCVWIQRRRELDLRVCFIGRGRFGIHGIWLRFLLGSLDTCSGYTQKQKVNRDNRKGKVGRVKNKHSGIWLYHIRRIKLYLHGLHVYIWT